MKAEVDIDDLEVTESFDPGQTIIRDGRRFARRGAVIDDPRAYLLVRMGVAIPADAECEERAGMTDAQMQAAKQAHRRVAAGIDPDDYALFDSGQINGYDPDGNYIPGPNWVEPELQSGDVTEGGVLIP